MRAAHSYLAVRRRLLQRHAAAADGALRGWRGGVPHAGGAHDMPRCRNGLDRVAWRRRKGCTPHRQPGLGVGRTSQHGSRLCSACTWAEPLGPFALSAYLHVLCAAQQHRLDQRAAVRHRKRGVVRLVEPPCRGIPKHSAASHCPPSAHASSTARARPSPQSQSSRRSARQPVRGSRSLTWA
jgi:hypothetical protein